MRLLYAISDLHGFFSLCSLIASQLFGNKTEFQKGVRFVIENLSFDHDITVSVFEANIRLIGGMFSVFRSM
jgi:hypothetical protein